MWHLPEKAWICCSVFIGVKKLELSAIIMTSVSRRVELPLHLSEVIMLSKSCGFPTFLMSNNAPQQTRSLSQVSMIPFFPQIIQIFFLFNQLYSEFNKAVIFGSSELAVSLLEALLQMLSLSKILYTVSNYKCAWKLHSPAEKTVPSHCMNT